MSTSAGTTRRYRERVYCYELYHQLRLLTCDGQYAGEHGTYLVSGEIDKAGLGSVIEGGRHKPDLVWHVPGSDENATVVEVKAAPATVSGLRKDVATLSAFTNAPDRPYQQGVLLVFGEPDEQRLRLKVARAARQTRDEVAATTDGEVDLSASWNRIELWLHEQLAAGGAAGDAVAPVCRPRVLGSLEEVVTR
jgi:hypothetical protein